MNRTEICTIRDLVFHGDQDPDHPAIESYGYLPLTYRDLRDQILLVVKTLNAQGFHRNDRIAVIMPAGPATAVMIVSVMTGFTAVPLNPQSREQEFVSFFTFAGITAIVTEKGSETAARNAAGKRNIPVIELIPDNRTAGIFSLDTVKPHENQEPAFADPADIASLVQTSGTTSRPKIVPYPQRLLCHVIHTYRNLLHYSASDRCLHIVPFYHGLGILGTLLVPLSAGGTVICTRNFIPSDLPRLLTTIRPTYFWAVPALHQAILGELRKAPAERTRTGSLRFIGTVSSFMPDSVRHELEARLGTTMVEVYGMSESALISFNVPYKSGSVGIPAIEFLNIMDEDGHPLGHRQQGEIVIKGAMVVSGYENAPEENAAAFHGGWFWTGDRGYIDDDGYLFITGRIKELINKGGEKISPEEIDAILKSHPGVLDAMSFGVADPLLGEDVAAMVVVTGTGVTEQELRTYVLDHLVQSKVPRRIYFVEEIPKTPTGKPVRYEGSRRYS